MKSVTKSAKTPAGKKTRSQKTRAIRQSQKPVVAAPSGERRALPEKSAVGTVKAVRGPRRDKRSLADAVDTEAAARPSGVPPAPLGASLPPTILALPAVTETASRGRGPKVVGTEVAVPPLDAAQVDLSNPALYLNRELTWLTFNARVLHEAKDARNPLLERLKFLAISDSNLDEFFMKRIGGLKQQQAAGVHTLSADGRTPGEQLAVCHEFVRAFRSDMYAVFADLHGLLATSGVALLQYRDLTTSEQSRIRKHYFDNIFPLVTPQAIDPAHPFPFVSNLSLNLLVTLRHAEDDPEVSIARVKVPVGTGIPRFLQVGDRLAFVPLEEVIGHNLDLLFPGMFVESYELFRVIRNADVERDEEEADDLLELIETELRERRFAPIVRLQVARGMSELHRGMLAAELGLDEQNDVFEGEGMLALRDLMEIASLEVPALRDAPHHPVDSAQLVSDRSIFHVIRDFGSILVHHPYESFATSVERFVREASLDPKVRAIKMTLYRTSSDSKIIQHLMNAARNGKQVAVVVELKARFDEEANIRWANRLESVGIHVTYGVVGLKTHSKVILVVRQDYSGLRRYAHIGTGNYHSGTARIYSDLGLFTCSAQVGRDLTELFNYLTTGYKPNRRYQKILPAPKHLKQGLIQKIRRETALHSPKSPGLIQMKMNALEDVDITRELYLAAQVGVKVDLIVRDTCRLRPGIPGLSESVTVISLVGRFLEHARIFYFRNGGDEEYYLGSADSMTRNLESRVECVAPVEEPSLREELRFILDTQLADQRSVWEMRPDGTYVQRLGGRGRKGRGAQQILMQRADQKFHEVTRLRRRRTKGIKRILDDEG